jgi:hypothetical protein
MATSGSCIVRACRCTPRYSARPHHGGLRNPRISLRSVRGYVHVACACTRQSRYFHCKEQARNNGPSFSATGSLHRHPRMQERCPIACRARPPGRIPALAFLKLHGCGLLYFPVFSANTTNPRRAAAHAQQKPGAVSRPGGWRSFGEYAFLEDSRYASQENYEGNLTWRSFLRFQRGRAAWRGRETLYLNASRPSARGCARGPR